MNFYEFCGYTNEIVNEITKSTNCQIEIFKFDLSDNQHGNKFQDIDAIMHSLTNVSFIIRIKFILLELNLY